MRIKKAVLAIFTILFLMVNYVIFSAAAPCGGEWQTACASGEYGGCNENKSKISDNFLINQNGICVPCGSLNMIACSWGCGRGEYIKDNLINQNGICVACGDSYQPECPAGYWCPPEGGLCIGEGSGCNNDNLIVNKDSICVPCGNGGPACYWTQNGGCNSGFINQSGYCIPCGKRDILACADGKCEAGLANDGGFCKCGAPNQPCCKLGIMCQSGTSCKEGICKYIKGCGSGPACPAGQVCQNNKCSCAAKDSACVQKGQPGPQCCSGLFCYDGRCEEDNCDTNPAKACLQDYVCQNGHCVKQAPTCAKLNEPCVSDYWGQSGLHCCNTNLVCNWGTCEACIHHGSEVLLGGTQICCTPGDTPIWDQASEKEICGIPSEPPKGGGG